MSDNYHSRTADDVLKAFGATEQGLSDQEATHRLAQFGPNEVKQQGRTTAAKIFFRQFQNFLVGILIFAAAISFLLGEITDAAIITAIVVLNAILGFVQEYRAEKAIEALQRLAAPRAKVLRSGKEMILAATEVVPGDVLLFEAGDSIAADARLFDAMNLQIDESLLTGESVPSLKFVEALPENTP